VFARLLLLVVLALTACVAEYPLGPPDDGPKTAPVFVIIRDWHTEIALPADAVDGRLALLRAAFPDATWLAFGIGERSFMVNESPGLLDMLAALFPSPTAIRVTGLRQPPAPVSGPETETVMVHVTQAKRAGLVEFISLSFEYAAPDGPRFMTRGPYPGSLFYHATPTYSGFYTCNTWTADALRAAGIPVRSFGTLSAAGLARQVRR
jgi:uncharacterized protein (TIGR02117 family)